MGSEDADDQVRAAVDAVYRADSRRVLATLIRLLGDFDLAEEAMHEAFAAAVEQWPRDGMPANPRAWLVSTGRFKSITAMRRRARFDASLTELAERLEAAARETGGDDEESVEDDRLRLIFTCCHPALTPDAQIALTLREVCGLTTEEIASAFFTSPSTVAQRIVRAKAKIRDARIPYQVPEGPEQAERLDAVLRVIYLVFNEGYAASSGTSLTRADLSAEAIRLGRLLCELMPDDAEAHGLLALMLFTDARRAARTGSDGEPIDLRDQDRRLWDRDAIAEATGLLERSLRLHEPGPYALQAGIALCHDRARSFGATDWGWIASLYGELQRLQPTPVVAVNRAVAVSFARTPEAGLELLDELRDERALRDYVPLLAARADLLRRAGDLDAADAAYAAAIGASANAAQRDDLNRRRQRSRSGRA